MLIQAVGVNLPPSYVCLEGPLVRESEINQKGKARKLWDIEEGTGI